MGVNLCDEDAYRKMSRANTELKVLKHTQPAVCFKTLSSVFARDILR